MNTDALDLFLRLHAAHAGLTLLLDEELGTHHGLALADFVLLGLLAGSAAGRLPMNALRRPSGLQGSALLRRVLPLEKVGLVERQVDAAGERALVLRPAGRQLCAEARETAAALCAQRLVGLDGAQRDTLSAGLQALATAA
jgi:DNA-binding MarR family transcriptional regulator